METTIIETTLMIIMLLIVGFFLFYLDMKYQRKISGGKIEDIEAVNALDIQTLVNKHNRDMEGYRQDKINMRNDFRYDLIELRKLDLNQDGKRGSIAVDDHIQKLINDIDIANHKESK